MIKARSSEIAIQRIGANRQLDMQGNRDAYRKHQHMCQASDAAQMRNGAVALLTRRSMRWKGRVDACVSAGYGLLKRCMAWNIALVAVAPRERTPTQVAIANGPRCFLSRSL